VNSKASKNRPWYPIIIQLFNQQLFLEAEHCNQAARVPFLDMFCVSAHGL